MGWEPYCHPNDYLWSLKDKNDNIVGKHSRGGLNADHCWKVCNLDFCHNHNAAVELRKAIKPEERTEFVRYLMAILGTESPWAIFDASPRQQAEAFLRMRGKWRE